MRNYPSITSFTNSSSSSMAAASTGVNNIDSHSPLLPGLRQVDFDKKKQTETELAKRAGECVGTWEGHGGYVFALTELKNGWVVSGSQDDTIKCWKMDERGDATCLGTWKGHQGCVYALAVLPNGWVVSGSVDKTIKCWKVDERGGAACLGTWEGHGNSVVALAVLQNGWVVSGSRDNTIKCWQVDERGGTTCVGTWEGHGDSVRALAVLQNGWVVSGSHDRTIKCWKVDERGGAACLGTWEGHGNAVVALAVLPNGWVVSGSTDKTIKCWKVDERGGAACLGTWEGHGNAVVALGGLQNGWVVSGSRETQSKTVYVKKKGLFASGTKAKTESTNVGIIKCWRGAETLLNQNLFELLNVARVFLLQSSQSDLPVEIKLQIVEIFAMNMRYRLPQKMVKRCFDYAADRATLREKALTEKGFLKYLSYAADDVENINSLFKTPAYLEPKAKYYVGLQYKQGDFEDISLQKASREALYWFRLAAQEGVAEALLELEKMPDLADNIVSDNSLLRSGNVSYSTSSTLPVEEGQRSFDVLVKSEKMQASVKEEEGTKKCSRSTFERAGFFTMSASEQASKEAKEEEKNTDDNNSEGGFDREVSPS